MSYFLRDVFRTGKRFWLFVAFLAVAAVAAVDSFASMQGGKLFGGKLFGYLIIVTILGMVAFLIFRSVKFKRERQLDLQLDALEVTRKAALQKSLRENPEYRTFCHECRHFNRKLIGCRLHLAERRCMVKLSPESHQQYCLYWNFAFPSSLEQALLPKKSDQTGLGIF